MLQGRRHKAMMETLMAAARGKGTSEDFIDAARRFDEEDKASGAALSDSLGVEISSRVDGEGAFYGSWWNGENSLSVYVYPPVDLWNGDHAPTSPTLHETDWQIMVGGEKVAQAAMIKDLPALSDLDIARE